MESNLATTNTVPAEQPQDTFLAVMNTVPAVLNQNKTSILNAVTYGENLLKKAMESPMTDEMDKAINDYLVKARTTVNACVERHTPITQSLRAVGSEFTTALHPLDTKRPEAITSKLQLVRNNYAAQKAAEAKRIQEEATRKLNIQNEKSSIKAGYLQFIEQKTNEDIFTVTTTLQNMFNGMTLPTWSDDLKSIRDYNPSFSVPGMKYPHTPLYITREEMNTITSSVMTQNLAALQKRFDDAVTNKKADFHLLYQSKKNELDALESAGAEEKKRLEKERQEREQKEREAAAQAKLEADKQAEEAAQQQKQFDGMNNLFASEAALSKADAPKRTGYKINVTNPFGYKAIMSLWAEKELASQSLDKIENVTLKRMKTFCEKHAHKTGEKIQNPYIQYEELFTQKAMS